MIREVRSAQRGRLSNKCPIGPHRIEEGAPYPQGVRARQRDPDRRVPGGTGPVAATSATSTAGWAVAHDAPSPGRFDGPPLRDTAPLVALWTALCAVGTYTDGPWGA